MPCRAHISCRSTCRLRRDSPSGPDVSRASSQKNLREKARREKAAAKRERREATAAEAAASAPVEEISVGDQPKVLAELAELHERYEADQIDFEEFESRKQALLGQLHV